jgi:predicted nucleotidyltransferase
MDKKWISYNVKEAIKSIDPKAKVILFGSKARGDDKSSSDWDFLVLTSTSVDEKNKD